MDVGSGEGPKYIVGGLEDVVLPLWGIPSIRARVDTGARISSIHAEEIKTLPGGRISFYVVIGWKKERRRKHIVTHIKKSAEVRPSTGKKSLRWVVETDLKLGPISKRIEITLADRRSMTFRFLLGRAALGHDFLVDPSRIGVLGRKGGKS